MKNKYFYPIFKLKIKSWIKYWLVKKTEFKGKLSEILEGFSFTLNNTLAMKFNLFEIYGNSIQDGTPSPDNEVPILSAGDNENLFDKDNANILNVNLSSSTVISGDSPSNRTLYIPVQPNTTYTVSKAIGTVFVIGTTESTPARNLAYSQRLSDASAKSLTITTNSTAQYLIVWFWVTSDTLTLQEMLDSIKIEQGNKASGYSPYGMGSINEKITNSDGTKEQDYSIFVQQPFRSIGDVRDIFFKNTVDSPYYDENLTLNGWYEVHLKRMRLTSDINITTDQYGTNSYDILLTDYCKYIANTPVCRSTHFRGIAYEDRATQGNNIIYTNTVGHVLVIRNTEFATIEELKAFFDNNEVYVEYLPETPLDLPCTQAQIDVLENMPSTYKDFTIINSEDETPAHLKIQYYKEG